jgi:thioredoxin reductase (NADPH)
MMAATRNDEVVIIGGGLAGLSAAVYVARALRKAVVIDAGEPMADAEPDVQNYLGFAEGIAGRDLLDRARTQARRFGATIVSDRIASARQTDGGFELVGEHGRYEARKVLLATGMFHLPAEVPGFAKCLGTSVFFCRDCDAVRVHGKRIAIIGHNDAAAEYALAMLAYSPEVVVATNGKKIRWSERHTVWLKEYRVAVLTQPLVAIEHDHGHLRHLRFAEGTSIPLECAFAVRGDVYHYALAKDLGAAVDAEGQVLVDADRQTDVPGLDAAGCVTQANCQMIIAAGDGATAAQAINRSLFQESLAAHALPHFTPDPLRDDGR